MTVRARHVICLLHDDPDAIAAVVARYPGFTVDHEFSLEEPDPRMRKAFEASMDRVDPSMTDDDWAAIDDHRAVTYVLSPPIEPSEAVEISTSALRLIGEAFAAGALAAKGESSGIAHGAERWKQLAADLRMPPYEIILYTAWVRRPIGDDDVLYTCGMQLLGQPDVELSEPEEDGFTSVLWLDSFAYYQLLEVTQDELGDGHKFRPDAKHARRLLRKAECTRYPDDDFFFNPHGYWRLEPTSEEPEKKGTKSKPAKAKPAKAAKASPAKAVKSKPAKASPAKAKASKASPAKATKSAKVSKPVTKPAKAAKPKAARAKHR